MRGDTVERRDRSACDDCHGPAPAIASGRGGIGRVEGSDDAVARDCGDAGAGRADPGRRAAPARHPILLANGFSFFPETQRAPVDYQTVKGRVIFRAKLGEREVWALLDNGADRTLIDLQTARAGGYRLDGKTTPVYGAGGGSLASQWVSDVPVSIAGQFEARMPMLGLDMREASKILGYPIELVLGADALMHMALMIDPFSRTFHLTRSGEMDGITAGEAIALKGKRALVEIRIAGKSAMVGIDFGSNGGLALSRGAWTRAIGAKGTHWHRQRAGATGQSYDVEVYEVDKWTSAG